MFDEMAGQMAGRSSRVEPRRRAEKLLLGLVSQLPRKNCWTIAEHVGDAVRDDLRDYVCDHLGEQNAVLIVDETGDLKKGIHTVGVQRQYTGTAGRIENSQVAVYLTYATTAGHAFIDRALYRHASAIAPDAGFSPFDRQQPCLPAHPKPRPAEKRLYVVQRAFPRLTQGERACCRDRKEGS
jgi:hypothetical protein